jgi:uncharacterized membrane protein
MDNRAPAFFNGGNVQHTVRLERSGWRWTTELFLSLAALVVLASWVGPAVASKGSDMRGFVSEGIGDVLLFNACQGKTLSKKPMRLMDKTSNEVLGAGLNEVRQMMLDSTQPIYAEFRGDAAGIVVTARQLHRVIGHIGSCPAAPTDVRAGTLLFASGEEPFWRFVLTVNGAQLSMEGVKQPVRFPIEAFKSPLTTDTVRIYDAWSPFDGGTIRVEIEERMCSDGRSETATGAKVTLRYGSQSFEGCATRF